MPVGLEGEVLAGLAHPLREGRDVLHLGAMDRVEHERLGQHRPSSPVTSRCGAAPLLGALVDEGEAIADQRVGPQELIRAVWVRTCSRRSSRRTTDFTWGSSCSGGGSRRG